MEVEMTEMEKARARATTIPVKVIRMGVMAKGPNPRAMEAAMAPPTPVLPRVMARIRKRMAMGVTKPP